MTLNRRKFMEERGERQGRRDCDATVIVNSRIDCSNLQSKLWIMAWIVEVVMKFELRSMSCEIRIDEIEPCRKLAKASFVSLMVKQFVLLSLRMPLQHIHRLMLRAHQKIPRRSWSSVLGIAWIRAPVSAKL